MALYPVQKDVVNCLIQSQRSQPVTHGCVYLSGEMGVGKTYMASEMIAKQKPTVSHPALVVVPNTVFQKWQDVLHEFLPASVKILGYRRAHFEPAAVYVVRYQQINDFVMPENLSQITANNFCEFVADEVHLLSDKQKAFKTIGNLLATQRKYTSPALLMTGTIFNQNVNQMFDLLTISHPEIATTMQSKHQLFRILKKTKIKLYSGVSNNIYAAHRYAPMMEQLDAVAFIRDIWKLIAVQVNLKDIKRQMCDETVTQTPMPVIEIKPTELELAYYNAQIARFRALNRSTPNNARLAAESLDDPEDDELAIISRRFESMYGFLRSQNGFEFHNKPGSPAQKEMYYYSDVQQELNQWLKESDLSQTEKEDYYRQSVHLPDQLWREKFKKKKIGIHQDSDLSVWMTNGFQSRMLVFDLNPLPDDYVAKKSKSNRAKELLSASLSKLPLKETSKYQALLEMLKQNQQQNSLIFVNQSSLIKALRVELEKSDVHVITGTDGLNKSNYAEYLNGKIVQANGPVVVIVNPLKINVGVDIQEIDNVIWYQPLTNLTTMLQAQRRVYRLSSTRSSQVYFIAYSDTVQVDLVLAVANRLRTNQATTGRDTNEAISSGFGSYYPELSEK